jgi:prevent-host-death family protein
MTRQITQRELRNEGRKIMRALDRGERFVVTRNGVPVGVLQPLRHQFVRAEVVVAAFKGAGAIAPKRFRRDVDRHLDQNVRPRP